MIGKIEQAIVDRLAAATSGATPALGYKVPTVRSYGGELEGPVTEIAKRFPAFLVVFAGIDRPEQIGSNVWRYPARFAVIAGNQDRRNNTVARRGIEALGEPGSYQMLTDALQLLVGSDLGLEIRHLEPGRVVALINSKTVSVYSAELTTDFEIEYEAADADLDAFEFMHTDWDIPPHGNVAAPLPTAETDAEDDIEPEQE